MENEGIKTIIAPFVGLFDIGKIEPDEIPDDINHPLDEDAARIPRMIPVPAQAPTHPRTRQPRGTALGCH